MSENSGVEGNLSEEIVVGSWWKWKTVLYSGEMFYSIIVCKYMGKSPNKHILAEDFWEEFCQTFYDKVHEKK